MRPWLARCGFAFAAPEMERRFVEGFVAGDLVRTRTAMVLGCAIFYAFSLWDGVIAPDQVRQTHLIRLAVVALAMLPATALLSWKPARAHVEVILLIFSAVPTLSLAAIYGVIADAHGFGACLITVMMFVAMLLRMRTGWFFAYGLVLLATAEIFRLGMAERAAVPEGVGHVSLLIAMVLALYAVAMREAGARRQFLTDNALREARDAADTALVALREAQAHLVQHAKLAALGRLVAGIAHEINTPVGTALTAATALERDATTIAGTVASERISRSELTRGVERLILGTRLIAANLARAIALVGSFKEIAVDPSLEPRCPIDGGDWACGLVRGLDPTLCPAGHAVEIVCDPGLTLDTRPRALAQAVTALVANAAVHAFPAGRRGRIVLSLSSVGADLHVAVRDDGVGIAAPDLEQVFEPFFTTRRGQGHVGLGLHVAHNLVAGTLGGRVAIASEKGVGTTATIMLPGAVGSRVPEPRRAA